MELEFDDSDVEDLETNPNYSGQLPQDIVSRVRMRLQQIRAAKSERDLFALRSLRVEKLKGKRNSQYSMRINDQWRLVFKIETRNSVKRIRVIEVVDYH